MTGCSVMSQSSTTRPVCHSVDVHVNAASDLHCCKCDVSCYSRRGASTEPQSLPSFPPLSPLMLWIEKHVIMIYLSAVYLSVYLSVRLSVCIWVDQQAHWRLTQIFSFPRKYSNKTVSQKELIHLNSPDWHFTWHLCRFIIWRLSLTT